MQNTFRSQDKLLYQTMAVFDCGITRMEVPECFIKRTDEVLDILRVMILNSEGWRVANS
jgi:hypothetical protein